MGEGFLDRLLAHCAQLLARRRRQDRLGSQHDRQRRRQGDDAGRHHERVVVDQLRVQCVHGCDVRNILPLGHAVRQDAHVELHLAVDDVEIVLVEPSREARVYDARLAFVENIAFR